MQRGLGSALASSQLPQPCVRPRLPACSSCAPIISIFLWVSPWGVFGVGWDRPLPCPGLTSCGAAPLPSIGGGREGCCALVERLHPQLVFFFWAVSSASFPYWSWMESCRAGDGCRRACLLFWERGHADG